MLFAENVAALESSLYRLNLSRCGQQGASSGSGSELKLKDTDRTCLELNIAGCFGDQAGDQLRREI